MKFINRFANNAYFLINNPRIIKAVMRNYFLKFIMSKKVLRTADICFDYACNYVCAHCYASDLMDKKRRIISAKDIKYAVDLCVKEGAIHFNLIGGEPTLNKNIFEIVDYIHKKPALISLATNGSMLSLQYTRVLKQHGVDVALISLDYLDEARQDKFRGVPGYFKSAMRGIENCIKSGLKVFISKIITKDDIKDGSFNAVLNFCKSKNILLHINLPTLYGRWKDRDDLFFDEEAKQLLAEIYKDKYVRACEMSSYGKSACASGLEKLHITPYGDVLPCAFLPISFGNIMEEDLSSIRKRMFKFIFINTYNKMCIPATNASYNHFFKTFASKKGKLPLKIGELNGFCKQ